jgi:secreted trypsin-like serine protease
MAWLGRFGLGLTLATGMPGTATAQSAKIIGGTPTSDWPAVGLLATTNSLVCTGTLVGIKWVLAAAHCFDGPSSQMPSRFLTGPGIGNLVLYRIRQVTRHPDYDEQSGAFDIAVVELRDDTSESPFAVRTVPLDASIVGSPAVIAGYGQDEKGVVGFKRTADVSIATLETQQVGINGLPQGCFGDSGGPIFETSGSRPEILGVLKSSTDPNCLDGGTYQRVDSVLSFLLDFEGICLSGDECPSGPLFSDSFELVSPKQPN